ncbi:MAG TPA: metallophosphoesterase [Candidatus Methylomirabilis sp.]|nr:metallophosphoesterase [Candidatus Methylomirabilis sp.]
MQERIFTRHHDRIQKDPSHDGIDRRGFLECMAWVGTGLLWTVSGGVLSSQRLSPALAAEMPRGEFSFVQISDSHIGFNADANRDVTGTLQQAIARINALQPAPAFLLHTGDLTHGQKPSEFDTLAESLKGASAKQVFYAPGEHDVFADGGKEFLARHGKQMTGGGWQSFDYQGVHFIGLNNVADLKAGGMGALGSVQLEWLEKDLQGLSSSTPLVVFAHIPLWAVYPPWGWGTDDGQQALAYLKRFGSVTVLNGHIHQTLQKVEGNITFHTAMSTAFPQPAPGSAPSPGPLKVPAGELRHLLGIRQVNVVQGNDALAIIDSRLA